MVFVRILFYLLQFYQFALTGAVAYLCARVLADPAVLQPKPRGRRWMGRSGHFVRAVAFSALAYAAMLGALYQGSVGIHMDALSLVRYCGYAAIVAFLPKEVRVSARALIGYVAIALGEILSGRLTTIASPASLLPYTNLSAASGFIACGLTLLVAAMRGVCFRVRVMDRLVIAFAVLSMFIAQLVVVLFLGLVYSIGNEMAVGQIHDLIAHADEPVVITLIVVIVMSAIIGYFVARDISAPMTHVEKALRAIGRGELDFRVQLRGSGTDEVHDLAREVNRMAESLKSAENMRAEFFSFVSHELRSPLTSIRGFIQTLEGDPEFSDADRIEIYKIIHEEADRLLRMIGELLDVALIESGKPVTLQTQRFDGGRHVEKVVEIMRAHTKHHELVVKRPEAPVWIEADPDKFDQILINLLSNAIKYSPDGGRIVVTLDAAIDSIAVSIADPGVGMTVEQVRHVFDKFYRVAEQERVSGRVARVEGSGIGLYLTRSLVEAHGGGIAVRSKPGEGSTFTVTLPREARTPAAQPEAASTGGEPEVEAARSVSDCSSSSSEALVSGSAIE